MTGGLSGWRRQLRPIAWLTEARQACPTRAAYPVDGRMTLLPITEVANLRERIDSLFRPIAARNG